MRIYPIYHSGFFVELEERYLLFDYYRREIPRLDPEKPLYVFITHGHRDHCHPEIQSLTAYYQHRTFVGNGVKDPAFTRIDPGQRLELDGVEITALDSTDRGVALLVRAEGRTIFHAGDLHLWYWDDDTPEERRDMYRRYCAALAPLKGVEVDVAFLVLDSRQSDPDALMGIELFDRMVEPRHIIPMHYGDGAARMEARIPKLTCRDKVINPRRITVYEL